MKVLTVLGTRPEIIKLSPIIPLLDAEFDHKLVHTGQHYSHGMDAVFFEELMLRAPDYNLHVGSGTHGSQVSRMLAELENIMLNEKPSLVIVQGDTNSVLAGSLAAAKLNIPVAHVEAGCRSFNRAMPEEINRIVADHVSDILFASDEEGVNNLLNEGIPKEKIHLVGRPVAVACRRNLELAKKSKVLDENGLEMGKFILATMHRAENTDNASVLSELFSAFNDISLSMPILLPLHPRTAKMAKDAKINLGKNVRVIEPLGYLDFLKAVSECYFVMTDSGGVQEEAVEVNVPCLILRNETEHVGFIALGKNILAGTSKESVVKNALRLIEDAGEVERMKNIAYSRSIDAHEKIVGVLKELA